MRRTFVVGDLVLVTAHGAKNLPDYSFDQIPDKLFL